MSNDTDSSSRLLQPFTARWLLLFLGIPVTYAILRYHVFKGVEWSHFPLYTSNKAFSLAAIFFVALSYLIGKTGRVFPDEPAKRLILIKFSGLMGFSLAAIHAFMALLLFSSAYYPSFFGESGKMNLTGELSMLFGVLSLWCLAITAITSLPFMHEAIGADRWQRGQRMGYLSLTLAAGHVLVMGLAGWFEPSGWPGGLPPISLLGFIAAIIPVLIKLLWTATDRGQTSDS